MFQDEKLPHELFLTERQTTKVRNEFANDMLAGKKRKVKLKYLK